MLVKYSHVLDRLDGATSGMPPPPHPFRSPIPSVSTAGDRESYAHSTNYSARSQLSPNSFGSYNDTPRSVLPGLAMSAGSTGYPVHMAATTAQGYNGSQNDSQAFPWPKLEVLLDMTCEGKQVTPEIRCKVEKGFFLSTADQKWTCYRRNYFSVQCSFEIHPFINNGRLYLKRMNSTEQIQAFGIRLSAAVDGSNGKGIELVQHTPKRDNGPKNKIEVVKLSPSAPAGRQDNAISPHHMYPVAIPTFRTTGTVPGPFLPLQNSSEPNTPSTQNNTSSQVATTYPYHGGGSSIPIAGQSTIHNFERVQFKTATANNGKRRASQQYFHLIMELFADVRKDGSDNPQWVKVAHRSSDKIVVRGRSPSHYQNEGQNNQAGRGGNAGGGNNYPAGGAATYAGLNTGGYRTSAGAYGGGIGAGHGYRQSHHVFHPASGDSASSPESVEVGAIDSDHPMDAVLSDSERASIQEYEGYQYYPSATYENVLQLPPLSKPENTTRYSTEPRQYAVKAEYPEAIPGAQWQMGGCSRFQGFESSRGYFPDLSAGTPSYS